MDDSLNIQMSDTTGYLQSADSVLNTNDSIRQLTDTVSAGFHTFIPNTSGDITPLVINQQQDQWFLYVLLGLSLIVSVIWYYIPERLTNIFSLSAKTILKKSGDKTIAGPGIAVTVFFLINSLMTASFLILYVIKYVLMWPTLTDMPEWLSLAYIAAALIVFSTVKIILVRLSGFLFRTGEMAQKQQFIYFNSYNAIGVVLLPLLFILLIVGSQGWLYFILCFMAAMFIYRWVQIVVIGMHQTRFNSFHLILYLCTLEIIPLVILLKMFI